MNTEQSRGGQYDMETQTTPRNNQTGEEVARDLSRQQKPGEREMACPVCGFKGSCCY